MKNIIVAYDNERAIGKNGSLLWGKGEMRGDMEHFRELTLEHTVIMGRKTLQSIGMRLPGRTNILVSRSDLAPFLGVDLANSISEAYDLAPKDKEIFIIGGGEIYQQALKDVQRIYATEVDAIIDGADTYFPKLDDNWQTTDVQEFSDDNNKYPYRFVTYERK